MGYLIFGSTGFLGSRILDYLHKKGKVVTTEKEILNKKLNNYSSFNSFKGLDDKSLDELVVNFHTIIDASGISRNNKKIEFEDFLKSNAIWPYRLAKACIKAKVKLIWFSSIHANKYELGDFEENFDKYSLSKYLGENLIKDLVNWKEKILILRLGNIIGAPGKSYYGNSNLFAMNIASSIVKNQKAFILNQKNININLTSIQDLLGYIDDEIFGFIKVDSEYYCNLIEIAFAIKLIYEDLTKQKAEIFHNNKIINLTSKINHPKKILTDMKDLINFYLQHVKKQNK